MKRKITNPEKRLQKVATFQIVKPLNMSWAEFGGMLNKIQYYLWRLANRVVAERFVQFQQWYNNKSQVEPSKNYKLSVLNRDLRKQLIEEKKTTEEELMRYSREGAISGYVYGAFDKMKLSSLTSKTKWRDVITGRTQIPSFKRDLAIPVGAYTKIEKIESGEFVVKLPICQQPYPCVLLSTDRISGGQKAVLERLVANTENTLEGYRQRFFEIKSKKGKWHLSVIYDFPKSQEIKLDSSIVLGVDFGYSTPLYVAVNNGKARWGYKTFGPLGEKIKILRKQIAARRYSIQRGGQHYLAGPTSRSGHGVSRILLPTERLQGRINDARRTINHQFSHCLIKIAKEVGAGVIQIENLDSLKKKKSEEGGFLGQNWNIAELQNFIKYKAKEAGIEVREVNPCYTSRRCSECGFVNVYFTRTYRDANRENGKPALFECSECGYKDNADYNAARNLATIDIEEKIQLQCEKQGIMYKKQLESSLTSK